jgi:tetratricopeptide (TPR) repeat protein
VQIGDFDRAASDLRSAMEFNRQTGEHHHEHRLLLNLGMLYRRKDEFENAREHLNEALQIAREVRDPRLAAETLYHLGTVVWSEGKNNEALRYHQEAVDLCEQNGITDLVAAQAIHGLGEYYWLMAKPNLAIELFNRSISIARQMNDKGLEDENLTNLGAIYLDILKADYHEAQKYIRQALDITIDIQLSWHAPPTLFILALSEGSLGNYASAVQYATQAVDISERLNSRRYLSVALDFLGNLYQDLGLNTHAETAHARGLEIARSSGAGFWLPGIQADLAIDRIRLGRLDVGEDLMKALEYSQRMGLEIHTLHVLEALAELECARGNPDKAIEYADQLLRMALPEDLREKIAQARRWRSMAFLTNGQYERAENELDQAMQMATAIVKPRLQYDLHILYSRTYEQQGDHSRKTEHDAFAKEIYRSITKDIQVSSPELGEGYLSDK